MKFKDCSSIIQKVIAILIVFSFPLNTIAQRSNRIYKNQIKFSTFRIVDFVNQGIELNYERSHSKKFAFELSAAYMGNIVSTDNFEGFRIGLEEKRFITQTLKRKSYVSSQIVYNNSSLKEPEYLGFDTSLNRVNIPPYTIVKKTAAINVKVGFEYLLQHVVIDFFIGGGVKYREVKHIDRKFPFPRPKVGDFFYETKAEGSSWTMNLPFTLKIGYTF